MQKTLQVEISYKTILFTIGVLLGLLLVWIARDLLFSLFIAFIITSAIKPIVTILERKKIPRHLSTAVIFILFLSILVYIIFWLLPPVVSDMTAFFKNLPNLTKKIAPNVVRSINIASLNQYLPSLPNKVFEILMTTISNIVLLLSTLFFSFYFVVDEGFIKRSISRFYSEEKIEPILIVIKRIEKRMSSWFWGELVLMTTIGVLTFIGLSLIGVKHALPLAVIAGLLEAMPTFGPIVSAIPAFIVGWTQTPFIGFSSIALYFIVQQLENNLIVPYVMRRAVGLHPIVTLISLIIGGHVGGIPGVLLAIPTTLFLETVFVELISKR